VFEVCASAKRKKGAQKKGGENSPISPPLDLRLGFVPIVMGLFKPLQLTKKKKSMFNYNVIYVSVLQVRTNQNAWIILLVIYAILLFN